MVESRYAMQKLPGLLAGLRNVVLLPLYFFVAMLAAIPSENYANHPGKDDYCRPFESTDDCPRKPGVTAPFAHL